MRGQRKVWLCKRDIQNHKEKQSAVLRNGQRINEPGTAAQTYLAQSFDEEHYEPGHYIH